MQDMEIFDGIAVSARREFALETQVKELRARGKYLQIAAILFTEDTGSVLYTRLKREAANRVGIGYQVHEFSMNDPTSQILAKIKQLNVDPKITGLIIQKPWKQKWQNVVKDQSQGFNVWWQQLVNAIEPSRDVDGLHPATIEAIKQNTWGEQGKVLPATCQAVFDIIQSRPIWQDLTAQYVIIGQSNLLGWPLLYVLQNAGRKAELLGRQQFADRVGSGQGLKSAAVIVSATGMPKLITGNLISPGVVLIDVGEPVGDVDRESVGEIPSFITPVPGGVGPMTVVSLLENAVKLAANRI